MQNTALMCKLVNENRMPAQDSLPRDYDSRNAVLWNVLDDLQRVL